MDQIKHYAEVETPVPGPEWVMLEDNQRIDQVICKLKVGPPQFLAQIQVISAKADGQVILQMRQSLPASQRGSFLLDLEDYLKVNIDQAIAVWLEPLGDRNSLRNLRGIEVKVL